METISNNLVSESVLDDLRAAEAECETAGQVYELACTMLEWRRAELEEARENLHRASIGWQDASRACTQADDKLRALRQAAGVVLTIDGYVPAGPEFAAQWKSGMDAQVAVMRGQDA